MCCSSSKLHLKHLIVVAVQVNTSPSLYPNPKSFTNIFNIEELLKVAPNVAPPPSPVYESGAGNDWV